MKKIILTFLSILLVQCSAMAIENTIRFAQITDAHFGTNMEYTGKVLKAAVDDINNQKGISFVAFTGDNIDKANVQDLRNFMKIINKLNIPYCIVLGNHDVFKSQKLSKVRYNEVVRENNLLWFHRKWNYAFCKKGFEFIVLDGSKEVIPGPSGYFREDTLTWFDKTLTKYSKRPIIVFQHYPVIDSPEFGAGRIKTHRTYQAEKYLEIVSKHPNVLAILSGHYHVNSEIMKDGIYHISTPTLLAKPNYYKIVDVVTSQGFSPVIYTQLKEVEIKE